MIINIRIADPDNKRAHNSLHNWLNHNQYIKENAELKLPDSPPEGMGPGFDVIQLVLKTGFDLANLALVFAQWRDKSRETAAPIAVQADNGRTTELSLDDMADSGDEAYVIRRALAGAPDPRQSSCVLIGVSDYGRLRELPAVRENLVQLSEALADPKIWGIPPEKLRTIAYPQTADTIRDAISAAAQDASDTLLVYFAGHGLYDKKDGLLLALPEATGKDSSQTVQWQQLAEVIRNADSHRRIVWLDCCYAGLALPDKEATLDKKDPSALLEAAKVRGTYLLAATQKYDEAKSPDGEGCTAFTGELVHVLRNGSAPGPPTQEFYNLNSLYQQVRRALRNKHLPEPTRDDPDHIGQLAHFHNNMTRRRNPRIVRSRPMRTWRLPNFPFRYVMGAGLGVLIVLVAVLLGTRPWAPGPSPTPSPTISASPLPGGLSLTEYCSTLGAQGAQGFTVAGKDCVQPINLDLACDFSYHATGLVHQFTSPDPDSAICYNPTTRVKYSAGIPDMTGYCATLTTITDVKATAANPDYKNTWVCQVAINMNLACDTQNNRTNLIARQVNGTWVCYKA